MVKQKWKHMKQLKTLLKQLFNEFKNIIIITGKGINNQGKLKFKNSFVA